jgi:hypothetical protein
MMKDSTFHKLFAYTVLFCVVACVLAIVIVLVRLAVTGEGAPFLTPVAIFLLGVVSYHNSKRLSRIERKINEQGTKEPRT